MSQNQNPTFKLLMQPKKLKKDLDTLVAKYQTLKASAERTVTIISLAPGHGQGVNRRLEDIEAEMLDLEKAIEKKKEEFIDSQIVARKLIWKLEDPSDMKMLELRYVDVMTWEQVAAELHYNKRYCLDKNAVALKNLTLTSP